MCLVIIKRPLQGWGMGWGDKDFFLSFPSPVVPILVGPTEFLLSQAGTTSLA